MKKELEIGGRKIGFDTETFAQQATASVMVRSGDTMVLTSIVFGQELETPSDFLPLTVEYREHISAAGKFPGGFFKREGRPTEKEILTCRLIDRTIRPLFPKTFNREIQISSFVFSADPEIDPDVLAVIGAAVTLSLSPFAAQGPVGTVRVARVNGAFIINPTISQSNSSDLSLVVSASAHSLLMLEGMAKNVPEETILEAISLGFKEAAKVADFIRRELSAEKQEKILETPNYPWEEEVLSILNSRFTQVHNYPRKSQRKAFFEDIEKEVRKRLTDKASEKEIKAAFEKELRLSVRNYILRTGKRLDGRSPEEIRAINCQVGLLPRVHGSALFRRGETQALALVTLGTWADEQRIEGLLEETKKRFILHYNFPAFSVGEIRPMRGPGRREIGHGALAEKALANMLPTEEEFPYTIRVVSDILESHGSSSMATVCAGSLGLMDAGVPVKKAVSGCALGLIKEGDNYLILSDIAGEEDHFGDLDLKIAGSAEGITAIQMDVKTTDLSLEILQKAFLQGREARCQILEVMNQTLASPRLKISDYAPKISLFKIPIDKIGMVIGPGGKNIRKITEETGVEIEIEDDGGVQVISRDDSSREKAIAIIKGMVEEPAVGAVYRQVKVTKILPFGAMVEFLPGQEGLVHISELDHRYVNRVEEVVKVGDLVDVKIIGIDEQHRVNLSRKALLKPLPGEEARHPTGRNEYPGRPTSSRPQPRLTHRAYRSGSNKEKNR